MIAIMQAPALQARAAQRDREDNLCTQLATRIVGAVSMFGALVLFIVCVVLSMQECCGDHTKYNEGEFNRECRSDSDKTADNLFNDGDSSGASAQSCYKRNINTIIVLSFAVYLLIVGVVVIVAGECLYSTEGMEARAETKLEDLAGAMKAQEIQRQLEEREERRFEREDRRELRDERREMRAEEKLEATRAKQEAAAAAAARGPYGGARRYSVGAPATMNTTPIYTQSMGPALVQSQPRGRSFTAGAGGAGYSYSYSQTQGPMQSYSYSTQTVGQPRATVRVVPSGAV
jgi:hypothetical protein